MTRNDWLQEKEREARRLQGIATNAIVPSRRDFAQFIASQRADLALIPRLKRRDPQTGGAWPRVDLISFAGALDDTDVAALAVSTAAVHGMSPDDLVAIRAALSTPLLRDDLCIDECQIYDSRLRGADALRIPVADLATEKIEQLCDIAVSLHMTPVLDIGNLGDLARAPVRPPYCVGLDCVAADGFADFDQLRALAESIPRHIVVVVLSEARSLDEALGLRGHVDGLVVGDALLSSARPAADAERFLRA